MNKANVLAQMQYELDYGERASDDDGFDLTATGDNVGMRAAIHYGSCTELDDWYRHPCDDVRRFSRLQCEMWARERKVHRVRREMRDKAQAFRDWLDPHASVALNTSHYTPVGPMMTFDQVEWSFSTGVSEAGAA